MIIHRFIFPSSLDFIAKYHPEGKDMGSLCLVSSCIIYLVSSSSLRTCATTALQVPQASQVFQVSKETKVSQESQGEKGQKAKR